MVNHQVSSDTVRNWKIVQRTKHGSWKKANKFSECTNCISLPKKKPEGHEKDDQALWVGGEPDTGDTWCANKLPKFQVCAPVTAREDKLGTEAHLELGKFVSDVFHASVPGHCATGTLHRTSVLPGEVNLC